jgi:hypothetical protein
MSEEVWVVVDGEGAFDPTDTYATREEAEGVAAQLEWVRGGKGPFSVERLFDDADRVDVDGA